MSKDFANIRAIFFDTSDTLYKSAEMEAAYPQKLVELIATTRNIPADKAKRLLNEATEKLKATEKHVTKVRAAAEFGFSRAEVHEKAFCMVRPKDYLSEDTELEAVISMLTQHYKLGIISNLKRSHMLEIFEALGLSPDTFPLMVTEDIVTSIKPDPEPFLKAIGLAKCTPKECLYVGDSPTKDMQPAKEVGMKTVLIADNPSEEDMKYADVSISNVKDIAGVVAL
jgi:HAD superfamily hydrolase (TIGR01549 family)